MKLHELLAVEGNLEDQSKKVVNDLSNTFQKKQHLFSEKIVKFESSVEDEESLVEAQSDIQSTVNKELDWVGRYIERSLDASFQVAKANTEAKADIVLENGETVAKDVPATALLELEKRVASIQALIKSIPTLDPAKGFELDSKRGSDYFKAREVQKTRTRKKAKVIVLHAPTTEHPAQTQLVNEDVPIGKIVEREWSSLISPNDKSDLINKSEQLYRAIRQARSRANEQVIDRTAQIGSAILKTIFG